MEQLKIEDVYWITRRLPKCVSELLRGKTKGSRPPFLAGGFIRAVIAREEASDIDLFAANQDLAALYASEIAASLERGQMRKTDNAYTVYAPGMLPIQVIHRWTFEKPEDVIQSFDFTIAQVVIWYDDRSPAAHGWKSACVPDFYADLAAKRLVYKFPIRHEEAGGSILRLLKFYRKGYTAPLDTVSGVISRLVGGVKNIDRLDERGLARVITGLLRQVDPLLDPLHVFHDPSVADIKAEGQEGGEPPVDNPFT